MIKLIIRNPERYKKLSSLPVLKNMFFFDLRRLAAIKDEALFFKAINQLRMKNGIYKTTRANRFIDVDNELVSLLNTYSSYTVHDVAVSDGITSVDLYNKFSANNIKASLTISDKFATMYAESKWYGATFKDAEGIVLYNDFCKIQAYRTTSVKFIVSKLLGYLFPAHSKVKATDAEILMLNPKTTQLMDEGKITFRSYDIFEKSTDAGRYDIVRCMNVLNYKVFPDDAIINGVANLAATVKEDGLFVLGRTQDGTGINNVSIFRKKENGLLLVKELNNGSEVKFLLKDMLLN
jgi:hypothetical protein